MLKNKYFVDFKTFESAVKKSNTEDFEPPKYLVKPAEGDTGFYLVKKAFDKRKEYFTPSISSTEENYELYN